MAPVPEEIGLSSASTAKTMWFGDFPYFQYGTVHEETRNMMVMVISGKTESRPGAKAACL